MSGRTCVHVSFLSFSLDEEKLFVYSCSFLCLLFIGGVLTQSSAQTAPHQHMPLISQKGDSFHLLHHW